MSAYSDYKVGAIDEDEFRWLSKREEDRGRYPVMDESDFSDIDSMEDDFIEFNDAGYDEGWE